MAWAQFLAQAVVAIDNVALTSHRAKPAAIVVFDPGRIQVMMNKVLHLHAGLHKTGTSAIQRYLFDTDLGPDHTYFQTGMPNASLIILEAFKQDIARDPQFRKGRFSPGQAQRIQQQSRERIARILADINQPNTVISGEAISTLNAQECADLHTFLRQFFEEIRVYMYIRPLKSRIESAYQENLKTRYRDLEQPFPFEFRKSIGMFDEVFGRSQVRLSKFSRDAFPDGNVVNHFLNQIGLHQHRSESSEENTSLSLPAVQLLYLYRKYFPRSQLGDPERIQRLSLLPGESFHFHSELFQKLLRNPEGDIHWLEQRAGFSIAENVAANDQSGIRNEQDLTRIPAESVAWLKEQQGNFLSRLRNGDTSMRSLAMAVRSLRSAETLTRLLSSARRF